MIIKRPIFFLEIEGDLKKEAVLLPITVIASFEKHLNKTYVVVFADDIKFMNNVKTIYSKIKSDGIPKKVYIRYSESGINFINNNN